MVQNRSWFRAYDGLYCLPLICYDEGGPSCHIDYRSSHLRCFWRCAPWVFRWSDFKRWFFHRRIRYFRDLSEENDRQKYWQFLYLFQCQSPTRCWNDFWLAVRFYSAISFFISGRMVDYVNLKQRRVQLLVVTEKQKVSLQHYNVHFSEGSQWSMMLRGLWSSTEEIVAFSHLPKELKTVEGMIQSVDNQAFVSVASGVSANRPFYEW